MDNSPAYPREKMNEDAQASWLLGFLAIILIFAWMFTVSIMIYIHAMAELNFNSQIELRKIEVIGAELERPVLIRE